MCNNKGTLSIYQSGAINFIYFILFFAIKTMSKILKITFTYDYVKMRNK